MGTIQYQKIGLRIAGTKSRNGGFTPLVAVGILAGNEGDNMDKITVVSEKPVYVIKHSKDYILYQLIDRKVKPCDRDTVGILSIALTIARDVQLANSKSPYSLLKEVYGKFVNNYMEHSSDGLDKFIDKDFDKFEFESILEEYPLETRSSTYIPMNPDGISGILCVPQDKMIDLFRDSQYSEFASFKEIEIGMNCTTMPDLENIEIPRPKIYSIMVNGIDVETTMKKLTDFFDTAKILHDTQDITYDNIHFSLAELLESPNHRIDKGRSYVELDTAHNRIVCNVYKKQITYTLEYFIESTEKNKLTVANMIATNQVKLTLGANIVEFSSNSPTKTYIPASCANKKIDITPNFTDTHKFSVHSSVDDTKRSIIVTIAITPLKTIGEAFTVQDNRNYKRNTSNRPTTENSVQKDYEPFQTSDSVDTNTNPNNFKRSYARLIFFIGVGIGMCIGFGVWGIHSFTIGKITSEDSIIIYKIKEAEKNTQEKAERKVKEEAEKQAKEEEERRAQEEEERKAQEEERKAKEEEEEAKKKAEAIAKTKKEILGLVNKKDYAACERHKYWKEHLTEKERNAVYWVLNVKGQIKKSVESVLKKKYSSWNELEAVRSKIEKIEREQAKQQ